MMAHDFVEMPTRSKAGTLETLLRCSFCFKTPMSAREDGCHIRELEQNGRILLSDYNPDGVKYFGDRLCITCSQPIMRHELRSGSSLYWCFSNQLQWSDGIDNPVWDVEGVKVPEEPKVKESHAG